MIPNHMRPNKIAESRSSVKKTNHLFDNVLAPSDLIYFAICDKPKLPYVLQSQDKDSIKAEMDKGIEKELYTTTENEREQERIDFLFDRLEVYRETMAKPYVTGKDLIINGVMPGEDFGTILEYAHKLRLAGIPKDNALRQTISYAIKLRKNNKR